MKRLTLYFLFFVFTSVAYGLPTFNTANVKTYYQALSASRWRGDALDVDTSSMLTMLSRHFVLSSDDSTDFNYLALYDTDFKTLYSLSARRVANQLDSGRSIDFSGVSITNTGNASVKYTVHSDFQIIYVPIMTCVASFWITKSKS